MLNAADFLDELRKWRLLDAAQHAELSRKIEGRYLGPRSIACEAIEQGWLTPFQAIQIHRGRGQELLLGSYVLLERLGEGGMGAVFKARNWKLGRVVALKLIRKERVNNVDAIRRFQREIRAAAQLRHPNIVHALDADEIGGSFVLVMEYVEGVDLAQLVKDKGPLPATVAREYVRQAALALAHAHEKGLVHRDIKPANLLLSSEGQVKLLDLGLARLPAGVDGASSSTMTESGAVMGTPDFLAPEQARSSHDVDIRADLYSLGCTLYFLLTGEVPFPGGTFGEKIARHLMDEPEPVEQLRPDVPAALAAVVRKLMAKKREDRYQTPAEVAEVLAQGGEPGASLQEVPATKETVSNRVVDPNSTVTHDPASLQPKPRPRRYVRLLIIGAVVLLGLALAGLLIGMTIASLR
jgi:serine/threonine protein kinase